jgi:WD40 repeat protein
MCQDTFDGVSSSRRMFMTTHTLGTCVVVCSLLVQQSVLGELGFVGVNLAGAPLGTPAQKEFASKKSETLTTQAMSILRVHCLSCHNEEKTKGGLRLTSRENALKGSDNGPVLVPRQANKSLLVKVLLPDSDPHMPPKKQLSEKDIATLRRWIDAGANWNEKLLAENSSDTKPIQFHAIPHTYQPVLALTLAPDEKRLAVARANRIYIHDLCQTNYPLLNELEAHHDTVHALAWSRKERQLAAGSFRRIMLWDASFERKVDITNNLVGRITALQFTDDGVSIAASDGVATKRSLIHLISTSEQTNQYTWSAHTDSIYALGMSLDGRRLASAGADKVIRLWELGTQKETRKLEAHTGHILALAFNPEGTLLASGGADKVLNLWETTNWSQVIKLNHHPAPVTALAWTADGKSLFTACEDNMVRCFTEFKVHPGEQSGGGASERALDKASDLLYSLAVTGDGKTVFAGCHDGFVYVWNAEGKMKAKLGSQPNKK